MSLILILISLIKSLIYLINVVKSIHMLNSIMLNPSILTQKKFSCNMVEYSIYRYYYCANHYNFYFSRNIWKLYSLPKFRINDIASIKIKSTFNDPDIYKQWYYVKNGIDKSSKYLSHELDRLWVRNITGINVTIGIISHGFETDHHDIRDNYNPQLSYNFIKNSPHVHSSGAGRTIIGAGLASAVANNNKCGVGAAPSSRISILQIFDDKFQLPDRTRIAKAMSYQNKLINIYLILWVFQTYPDQIIKVTKEGISALEKGHRYGRYKLGSIYLTSTGIQRIKGNNCAFNEYNQRPEIYVIGSLNKYGNTSAPYETCTAIVAAVLNAEIGDYEDLLYSTNVNNRCENSASGAYSASAISAGIVALLLNYNPKLTARQIMILMIEASTQYDTYSVVNFAGFSYSTALGFGMLNATKMVEVSNMDRIKYIVEQHICTTYLFKMNLNIPKDSYRTIYIYTTGCVKPEHCVTHIEQVYLVFTVTVEIRNSVTMYLISPSGTRLNIIEPRISDRSSDGFDDWSLKILGFYGEKPHGIWRLQIFSREFTSWLKSVQLKLYGICDDPKSNEIFHKRRQDLIWGDSRMDLSDSFVKTETQFKWEASNKDKVDIYSFVRYFYDQKKYLL